MWYTRPLPHWLAARNAVMRDTIDTRIEELLSEKGIWSTPKDIIDLFNREEWSVLSVILNYFIDNNKGGYTTTVKNIFLSRSNQTKQYTEWNIWAALANSSLFTKEEKPEGQKKSEYTLLHQHQDIILYKQEILDIFTIIYNEFYEIR